MKGINPTKIISIFLGVSYLLSACAGGTAPTSSAGSDKVLAQSVVYTGVIESILDDQWTINGITVTVDPAAVQDGPFGVGDQVKVEGIVNEDGSLTVSRVEAANPEDVSAMPEFRDDIDANSNDANFNDDNGNDSSANQGNANVSNSNDGISNSSNSNDDNGSFSSSNDNNSNDDQGGTNSHDDSNSNDDKDDDDNSND